MWGAVFLVSSIQTVFIVAEPSLLRNDFFFSLPEIATPQNQSGGIWTQPGKASIQFM